jgi:hypothetical protein
MFFRVIPDLIAFKIIDMFDAPFLQMVFNDQKIAASYVFPTEALHSLQSCPIFVQHSLRRIFHENGLYLAYSYRLMQSCPFCTITRHVFFKSEHRVVRLAHVKLPVRQFQ